MRILLILPSDSTYRFKGAFKRSLSYAPLTLTTLAALVPPELNAEIEIIDEGMQKHVCRKSYDVVGITCTASSSQRAYELARYWRSKGAVAVLGGVHPTLMPEEAAAYADSVVVGLAEETWPRLLKDVLSGQLKPVYKATVSRFLSSPLPRRDLIKPHLYLPVPTVLANRGCGNACDYCSIHAANGHSVAVRPVEEVVEEIRSLNTRRVILLDPCLDSDRDYALNFFEKLLPLRVRWAGLATVDVVRDKELFRLMVKSGCGGLLMGFESLTQSNMTSSRKAFNKVVEYAKVVRTLHDNEIPVLGCFVLGFDEDTVESLYAVAGAVRELEIDLPRYSVLTPFPGTELFARLEREGRIITRNWSLYDTQRVVFQPAKMTPGQLQKVLSVIWRQTYSLNNIGRRLMRLKSNRLSCLAVSLGFRNYSYSVPANFEPDPEPP